MGYDEEGMGTYGGYGGRHHVYHGPMIRLPWMAMLIVKAVAEGATAVFSPGAGSQVKWKEGKMQVSSHVILGIGRAKEEERGEKQATGAVLPVLRRLQSSRAWQTGPTCTRE